MKKSMLFIFVIAFTLAGCSLVGSSDDPLADTYAANYLSEGITVKYLAGGQTHTFVADSLTPSYRTFDAAGEADPLLQIINTTEEGVRVNGSIYSNSSDSPLGSVGGWLDPGQAFTVKQGTFSN